MKLMPNGTPPASAGMLRALNVLYRAGQRTIYNGTVDEAEVARRRAKNKVARRQRRINRKRGA